VAVAFFGLVFIAPQAHAYGGNFNCTVGQPISTACGTNFFGPSGEINHYEIRNVSYYGGVTLPGGVTFSEGQYFVPGPGGGYRYTPVLLGTITGTVGVTYSFNFYRDVCYYSCTLLGTYNLTVVSASPAVSSSGTASGTVGSVFPTYTITATNSPTSYNATGLPAGLSVNTSNGQITGTPTTYGTSTVTISATNAQGTGTKTLTITIARATPVITWTTPASIPYGTALSSTQLNATATVGGSSIPGTFTYSPASGSLLSVGTTTLTVGFVPTDTTNYNSVPSTTVSQVVTALTARTPTFGSVSSAVGGFTVPISNYDAAFTWGVSATSGSASISGGTLTVTGLSTGASSTVTVTTSRTGYTGGTATVSGSAIAAPVITSASTASGSVSAAFSTYTITATNSPTSFSATGLPSGLSLDSSNGQITGTPSAYGTSVITISATNAVATATSSLTISIARGTPVITWSTPAAITYGTALGSDQLNATATVGGTAIPGTFTYSHAHGAVLGVGSTTLSVGFVPTDTTNYNSVPSTTVGQSVIVAPQSITWSSVLSILTTTNPATMPTAVTDGSGTISYSVSRVGDAGCSVATASQPIVSFIGVGDCEVTASASATSNHSAASAVLLLTVSLPPPPLPDPVFQEFGKPTVGSCEALAPESLNWGGVSHGGWGESWSQWMHDGKGGAVCSRTLVYSREREAWFVA
jgi:hypothetical protein